MLKHKESEENITTGTDGTINLRKISLDVKKDKKKSFVLTFELKCAGQKGIHLCFQVR